MNKTDWDMYNELLTYSDRENLRASLNRHQAGILDEAYKELMYEKDKRRKLNASFGTWREWLVVAGIIALIVLV